MRTVVLHFLFLFTFWCKSEAQDLINISTEFLGREPVIAVDDQHNIYLLWELEKPPNYATESTLYYSILDSYGKNILLPQVINKCNSWNSFSPQIKINGNIKAVTYSSPHGYLTWSINVMITKDSLPNFSTISLNEVSRGIFQDQPDISFINDTTLIVVWAELDSSFASGYVYGQIITTSLNKIGDNFIINNIGFRNPKILCGPNIVVVLWIDDRVGGSKIYGRLLNNDGMPKGDSFVISDKMESLFNYFDASMDSSGNFIVVWDDGDAPLYCKWFDKNANAISSEQIIFSNGGYNALGAVDMDKNGNTVVVWQNSPRNNNFIPKVYGQRFTPDREFLGEQFTILRGYVGERSLKVKIKDDKMFIIWNDGPGRSEGIIHGEIADFYNPPVGVRNYQEPAELTYNLSQNFPNPFNPSTSISYNLPYEGIVTLKVCDILGNEITTLVNEVKPAGEYQTEFDASSLSSGIYIYTIQVNSSKGGFLDSKKMVVLK